MKKFLEYFLGLLFVLNFQRQANCQSLYLQLIIVSCVLHTFLVFDNFKYWLKIKALACNSSPCKNDGTCVNDNKGGYACSCTYGFTGQNWETRKCQKNTKTKFNNNLTYV